MLYDTYFLLVPCNIVLHIISKCFNMVVQCMMCISTVALDIVSVRYAIFLANRAGWTDLVGFYRVGKNPPVLTLASAVCV